MLGGRKRTAGLSYTGQMRAPPSRVVVHTSWRGLLTAVSAPLILLVLGGLGLQAGPGPVALVLTGSGLLLGLVVALDYPRRAVFDRDGVERVCFLRRQRLPWDRLVAIERTRPTTVAQARNLRAAEARESRVVSGGLVARGPRRRRWLLTDRIESRGEYDRLAELLRDEEIPTLLRAPRPHADAPPSDLYRRRSRHG